jgi:dihydrofolate synthase/folylpolyglutamate synthase
MDDFQKLDTLLDAYQHFGVRLGLDRVENLLTYLGNPQQQIPFIHVAGTNGKGSVCAYLSSVLTTAGYRVGRYTSPHLVHWTERICINEQPIDPKQLVSLLNKIQIYTDEIAAQKGDIPTQFEALTAAAWCYFVMEKVDIAVIEVGLGGRLDATNVSDSPLVSIITSISYDHMSVLGSTLAEIGREKAGILKFQRPAILGDIPPEAIAVFENRITELNCPALWVEPAQKFEQDGAVWARYQGISYPLPLLGDFQLLNSAVAIAALQSLQDQGWQISRAAIEKGMGLASWPGRLQWQQWRNQPLLIDGAHNPAGAKALRQYADQLEKPILWIMGMLNNKNHAEILQILLQPEDSLYLVPVPDHITAAPDHLAGLAQQICPNLTEIRTFPELSIALDQAILSESPTHCPILCGSLYLIGSFLAVTKCAFGIAT